MFNSNNRDPTKIIDTIIFFFALCFIVLLFVMIYDNILNRYEIEIENEILEIENKSLKSSQEDFINYLKYRKLKIMSEKIVVDVYCWSNDWDYSREEMYVNGEHKLSVHPLCECPEDARLERDLIGPSDITDWMKKAIKWTKEGKEVEFNFYDKEPE